MPKTRQHNEWFRTVSLGGRKSCPTCKCKLEAGESIWTWGEYIRAKWRNIGHFCKHCWEREVAGRLRDHTSDCGCTVNLVMYHAIRPDWMILGDDVRACQHELAIAEIARLDKIISESRKEGIEAK